jgi:hypothetical protein
MTDITPAAEQVRITAETEASREVTAQAAADNPNPTTDDAAPLPDPPPQAGRGLNLLRMSGHL